MITVPQAVEKIIARSRYLREAMNKNLINASALSRYIQPEVELMTFKKVTNSSVLMAVQRLQKRLSKDKKNKSVLSEPPDMIVRSNLILYYYKDSSTLLKKLIKIEEESSLVQKKVLFTFGRAETFLIANKKLETIIDRILEKETLKKKIAGVTAITIHLPLDNISTPGILNMFIKSLAWENINLYGVLTTETELTFLLSTEQNNLAFSILQSLFSFA